MTRKSRRRRRRNGGGQEELAAARQIRQDALKKRRQSFRFGGNEPSADKKAELRHGLVRENSALPPLKEKTTWRTVKDTLRGWVGMPTKDEERRKKREEENKKKLRDELQKEHDNKLGGRRTRRRRRRRRTRRRRRRRQRGGWNCPVCGHTNPENAVYCQGEDADGGLCGQMHVTPTVPIVDAVPVEPVDEILRELEREIAEAPLTTQQPTKTKQKNTV